MDKLLKKATSANPLNALGKFERFNLSENPFPSNPYVNQDSTDKRINGNVYEVEIRKPEYDQIEEHFLKQPQTDPNHLRLGYIIDSSYIGRGNGKSAFLVNLQQAINRNFCLDISHDVNKCFGVYVVPETGGRTRTFPGFVDLLFTSFIKSSIVDYSLGILRLEAITEMYPKIDFSEEAKDESSFIASLNNIAWYELKGIDTQAISEFVLRNSYLRNMPTDFPLTESRNTLFPTFVEKSHFQNYYFNELKRGKERLDFVFTHFVSFLQAAGFNGAYILIDDFERIPDFQSARDKRDFALELRSCLFDGLYTNARIGFYNFLLVLHAGVQRLISEAWSESGMENRSPISPHTTSNHIIRFEKLNLKSATLLVSKYLSEYRVSPTPSGLHPFTKDAIESIGQLSEYNAAKILKMAYDLLDKAASLSDQSVIDANFVTNCKSVQEDILERTTPKIESASSIDLLQKANDQG